MEQEGEKSHYASDDRDVQEHKLVTMVAEARQQRGWLGSAKSFCFNVYNNKDERNASLRAKAGSAVNLFFFF